MNTGNTALNDFVGMMQGFAAISAVLDMQKQMSRELAALRSEVAANKPSEENELGWMDAKRAAKYLGMCPTTFDKFRYESKAKIKGYKVGGKIKYQRKDLDSFVKLWEYNSE